MYDPILSIGNCTGLMRMNSCTPPMRQEIPKQTKAKEEKNELAKEVDAFWNKNYKEAYGE